MYWSRTGSIFDLLAWGLLFSLFWAGGCLLCAYVFRLRSREIPLTGMGVGFLLFILLSNLLAYGLPLPLANWVAAVLLFLCGVLGWLALEISPADETWRLDEILEAGCSFHFLDGLIFLDPAWIDYF